MGGHHYDYVRLVARAADAAGVRPIIATHRALDQAGHDALQALGDVRPLFSQTVYTRLSHLAGLAELKQSRGPVGTNSIDQPQRGWRRWSRRWSKSRLIRARSRHICQFASDCDQLFNDFTFEDGDQVFFTTVSELDLMGLTCFLANNPRSLLPTWHVQFHFSIFAGRPGEFDDQLDREARVHDCFQSALARVPYHHLKFHTTSAELLEQYQRFEIVSFDELPYPIEPRLMENQSEVVPADRPLRLTIAGGIRREKAQRCYLGQLINGLWDSHLKTRRVSIHLQTSRPRRFQPRKLLTGAGGPRAVRDFHQHVHLYPHPLPETDYLDLIGNSDIGLFFYDSRRYYSRRAGILGEFLASGKPVIVPSGCWLSRQIGESIYQHVEQTTAEAISVDTVGLQATGWDPANAPLAGGMICFDQLKNPWRCWYEIPEDREAQGVALQFRWQWPIRRGEFANISVRCLDAGGQMLGEHRQIVSIRDDDRPSQILFRCPPGTRRTEFVFRNAYRDFSLGLRDVQLRFLDFGGPRAVPLGRVGVVVADPAELPAAVDEIVTHYAHYLKSAVEFAESWAANHDPDFTIDALLDRQCRFRRAA